MHDDRNFLIHPSYIILFLVIAGITTLFLGFSGAYLYNRIDQGIPPVKLPSLFYWNTLILLSTSGIFLWSKYCYKTDQTSKYKISLTLALILTLAFLTSQIFAWNQLQQEDIFVNYNNLASYLYVISGLHFAHVICGIPFLVYFLYIAYTKMKTPVSVLIYFSDRSKKRKLDLLNIYWHFLDGLWIYLVLFFLLNYLIQ